MARNQPDHMGSLKGWPSWVGWLFRVEHHPVDQQTTPQMLGYDVYDNKLRFGYQYSLLNAHSLHVLQIKAFNTSLFQLGSQSILTKLKRLRFSALDSLSMQTQASSLGSNFFCK